MDLIDKIKKKYPQKSLAAMRTSLFEAMTGGTDYARNETLIQSALLESGYASLAKEMAGCKPSKKCRNPYCDSCQRQMFKKQRDKSDKFLWHPYQGNEAKARENLVFVTILHELVPFDQPDDEIVRFPMARVKSAIDEARIQLKAVRRTFKDQINFVGAFELEAVTGLLVCLHPVKGQVLAQMNGEKIGIGDKFILVHSHFVVDLANFPPHKLTSEPAITQFKARLKNEWPGKRQVEVSPLYKDKSVHDSLNRLADYPLKFPIKYYYRWNAMSDGDNLVIDGKKQNLARNHEPAVIAEMVNGVSEIGLNALYIRLGVSKASRDKAKKRRFVPNAMTTSNVPK